jgi:predicted component of type VI protein secretion system
VGGFMPAQLLSLDNCASIMLDKPILLVGRHPECDIQVDSRKISRRHCCIAQVANYLVIRDLGSTNGIRINGARVNEGKLVAGDEVTIGSNRYQVTWDSILRDGKPAPAAQPFPVAVAPKGRDVAPPASPVPAPVKPRPKGDELLEECDEPVPLSDEDDDEVPLAQRTPPSIPAAPAAKSAKTNGEEARILPDSLELAPRSNIAKPGAERTPTPP